MTEESTLHPVVWMLAVSLLVGLFLAATKRAEVAEWLAVRLLAYRDSVQHRKARIANWEGDLKTTVKEAAHV